METISYLPVIAVFFPLLAVFIVPVVEKMRKGTGNIFTALTCVVVFFAVLFMYPQISAGVKIICPVWQTGLGADFSLRVDELGFLAGLIGIILWTLSSIYAIEYMRKEHAQTRYNIFSLLSLFGLMGTFFTGNLLSLYICFEVLSIASYVLVIHEESPEAMSAGLLYLFMGIAGGLILLFSIIATYVITGTGELSLIGIGLKGEPLLPFIFWGFILGFGVKAGIFPVHIWLPSAHPIAPSPASALLSGVMIKAGAYGIIRTIYSIGGLEALLPGRVIMVGGLLILALISIFLGSAVAIAQMEIKRMLAYSSISQIGYVVLGAALMSPLGLTGGVVHIFNHAIIKGGLFLCAGAFIHQTGLRMIEDLKGIGKRMPITALCFTLGALSMIGFPPFNGFVSKWYLALGALEVSKTGSYGPLVGMICLGMLLLSSFMNLIYYGPVVYGAWFGEEEEKTSVATPEVSTAEYHNPGEKVKKDDPNLVMLIPMILLALGTVILGIFPHLPLELVRAFSHTFFPR
ncbi:MAG TPA: monovalent cation/H+ antiporter subunit D family protein [Elusimicrobia bacterium]|jgi:multicomponent Na+:H+ antiporter subunit D|nr:monovalent cation/H+ antiporter subunit D family protein [Elusimicrobiota bacterium]